MQNAESTYWQSRYETDRTGWDIGYPSGPLKAYIDQLEDTSLRILIPGAGNAHEAEYLWHKGFKNVYVVDIAAAPLENFRRRVPDFPEEQLLHGDFFDHQAEYDLILEQTFFCSFYPTTEIRQRYAKKMHDLLAEDGKLVGLWFDFPLTMEEEKRPYGGDREMYLAYLSPYFEVKIFEPAHNSIKPRSGRELFGIFVRK